MVLRRGIKNSMDNAPPIEGELYYSIDTKELYIYSKGNYKLFSKEENEPNILPKNCANCGAVLRAHICEYCGTRYY
jgi:ribosomal protein L32